MWDASTIAQIVSAGAAVVPGFFFMWRAVRRRFELQDEKREKRWNAIELKIDGNTKEILTAFKEHEQLDNQREARRDRQHLDNLRQIGSLKVAVAKLGSRDVNGNGG